ncbi:MAG: SdpI family protein [Lachnospiraceae bacterium]|nr:SdpI family protein [Lachnospiraceae bacterium]MBR4608618.1 SdpI family protein [Lachnospiraceae bacterium]
MKKAMWIISIFCLVGTALLLQFMPESVPMHYDAMGQIDRWGSRYEQLIVPIIILVVSLFWTTLILYYEKKAGKAGNVSDAASCEEKEAGVPSNEAILEKEKAEALSNARALSVVGMANAAMFTVLHGFLLYGAWDAANVQSTAMTIDVSKVAGILMGIFMIIAGNVLPKSRINGSFGVRIPWSTYNETTWRKTNRFGGLALVITGIVTILGTLLLTGSYTAPLVLATCLMIATVFILIYAHKVCEEEKKAG